MFDTDCFAALAMTGHRSEMGDAFFVICTLNDVWHRLLRCARNDGVSFRNVRCFFCYLYTKWCLTQIASLRSQWRGIVQKWAVLFLPVWRLAGV